MHALFNYVSGVYFFPKKELHLFLCPVVFNLELGDLDVLIADASLHSADGAVMMMQESLIAFVDEVK
jgi:hypothetical protein